ncbi:MAG TPA: biotin--[acetyl-CoA-carboxylase] ligase [Amnibacterium sp.]|uniref:biotin--[acetyl-CoA-carboxylase] ligase n=1 Tax=Amnibacterium sp. TaxID=1872496 RepID=UPI002F931403
MDLPRTAALASRLEWRDTAGSTNAELGRLAAADPAAWPAWSVLVTDTQTAGRGRLGRAWTAPPGTSLAISVLLTPRIPAERYGWLSLLAGTAMARSLRAMDVAAAVKWPNDVLIGGRKVCGLLAEALPGGAVLGAGLNHRLGADELPVPTATSLAIEGGPTDPDALIAGWLEQLRRLVGDLEAAGGDPVASGLHDAVSGTCETIGRRVRVTLPDGGAVVGTATGIGADGRIEVTDLGIRATTAIATGDVEHLRYE